MKKNYGFSDGDLFKLKDSLYCGKIRKILPLGYLGRGYRLAECEWSTNWNFDFSLQKIFALRNMIKYTPIKKEVSNEQTISR